MRRTSFTIGAPDYSFATGQQSGAGVWQEILRINLNTTFGVTSGDYVVLIAGNIGNLASNIISADPTVVVEIESARAASSAQPAAERPIARHKITLDTSGANRSPIGDRGLPFFILDRLPFAAGEESVAQVRLAVPSGQSAGAFNPWGSAVLENLTYTVFHLGGLTAEGIPFTWEGRTTPQTLTATPSAYFTGSALATSPPSTWASFWACRVRPAAATPRAATPAVVGQDIHRASTPLFVGAEPRGMFRRVGPADVSTQWYLGGWTFAEDPDPSDGFQLYGSDPAGTSVVEIGVQFTVRADALQGFAAQHTGPTSFDVYQNSPAVGAPEAEVETVFQAQTTGDAYRERTFFAESVLLPDPFVADGYPRSMEPRDVSGLYLRNPEERSSRQYVAGYRVEPLPDTRIDFHVETAGPMALEAYGIGRTVSADGQTFYAPEVVQASRLSLLSLSNFANVPADVPDTPELPGAYVQVPLNRETADVADLRDFPSAPTNSAVGRAFDPVVEFEAIDGSGLSWPQASRERYEWDLEFVIDENRRPGLLAAWREFLDAGDPHVRWKSDHDAAKVAYGFDPTGAQWSGPRAGVWSLALSVIQLPYNEDGGA